jgi:hypothetical protein
VVNLVSEPVGAVIVPKPVMPWDAVLRVVAFERSAICLRGLFVGLNGMHSPHVGA